MGVILRHAQKSGTELGIIVRHTDGDRDTTWWCKTQMETRAQPGVIVRHIQMETGAQPGGVRHRWRLGQNQVL